MLKVGIVGMGIRGQMYAGVLAKNPYAQLASFCEFDRQRLESCKKELGVDGYGDYREMIDHEKLDAVIIATPDFAHRDAFIYAVENGVDVMVEKPFADNLEDAGQMYELVRSKGVKCLVAFENRWNLPFVALKKYMQENPVGEILSINSILNDSIYVPAKMLSWASKSSPAWFLLSHACDMACFMKGKKVQSVYATGVKKKLVSMGIDTYDSIHTNILFEDGTDASFENCWVLPESMPMVYDFKFNIIAEKQSFSVNLQDQMVRIMGNSYSHLHTLGTPVDGHLTLAPGYMLDSFIEDVRLGRKPSCNEEDGYYNVKIVDAVHRSIREKRIVMIDDI